MYSLMPEKERKYANFGEYFYWAYSNMHMMFYAVQNGLRKYDRTGYVIRAKAFKAYKEGRWKVHDLFDFNAAKVQQNNHCWYCG